MDRQRDKKGYCTAPPPVDFAGYKRGELIAIATEQAQELADMRCVLYRETDALREELQVLQAENRALRETVIGLQARLAGAPQAGVDIGEEALKERLRPIVAKLLKKHRDETEGLRRQMTALQQEHAQIHAQYRQALLDLAQAKQRCAALEQAAQDAKPLADGVRLEEQHALKEAFEQAARQEETIQALTKKAEASSFHYRAQRAQAMDALRDVRESMEELARCLLPEEGEGNPRRQLSVAREKLMPFTRERGRH